MESTSKGTPQKMKTHLESRLANLDSMLMSFGDRDDQEQLDSDLEVASVLSRGLRTDPHRYVSPSKRLSATLRKTPYSPYRPSTVMTNLQRGNIQTITPSTLQNLTLHQMAAQGEVMMLQQELEDEGNIDRPDEQGFTALLWACANGQTKTVEFLIQHGADINKSGKSGENSLLLACCYGHNDITRILLENNIGVNYCNNENQGNSALHYSAYNNHSKCASLLLEYGIDITLENYDGHSAMDIAVKRCSKAVQKVIEEHMLSLLQGS